MVDHNTGKSLGYGFVRYVSPEDSLKAITTMNGHRVSNKRLLCKLANQSPSSFNSEFVKNPVLVHQTPSDNVYVKPLLSTTTEDDLRMLFGEFGPITECKVMVDRYTGVSRQIGFVRFETVDQATKAIENMNNYQLDVSAPPLIVKYADTKEQKMARKVVRQQKQQQGQEHDISPLSGSNQSKLSLSGEIYNSDDSPPSAGFLSSSGSIFRSPTVPTSSRGFSSLSNLDGSLSISIPTSPSPASPILSPISVPLFAGQVLAPPLSTNPLPAPTLLQTSPTANNFYNQSSFSKQWQKPDHEQRYQPSPQYSYNQPPYHQQQQDQGPFIHYSASGSGTAQNQRGYAPYSNNMFSSNYLTVERNGGNSEPNSPLTSPSPIAIAAATTTILTPTGSPVTPGFFYPESGYSSQDRDENLSWTTFSKYSSFGNFDQDRSAHGAYGASWAHAYGDEDYGEIGTNADMDNAVFFQNEEFYAPIDTRATVPINIIH